MYMHTQSSGHSLHSYHQTYSLEPEVTQLEGDGARQKGLDISHGCFLSLLLSTRSLGFIIESGARGLPLCPLGHAH